MDKFWKQIQDLWKKTEPVREKTGEIAGKIWKVLSAIGSWIYKLRSVILAIPVAIAAIWLAIQNMAQLPEQVGINLLANGEYEQMVSRSVAVMGPLAVTAVCLLLMFCSRRVVYPWLISVFSLILPFVILITNTFPA